MATITKKSQIGEILVNKELLTPAELDEGLSLQKEAGQKIGKILVELGFITYDDLLEALSLQLEIPYMRSISQQDVDPKLVSRIPFNFVQTHKLLPLRENNGVVVVAVADPLDTQPLDDVGLLLGKRIEVVLGREDHIRDVVNKCYDHEAGAAEQMISDLKKDRESDETVRVSDEAEDLMDIANKAPIIKLVNLTMFQAAKARASDIHIEPYEKELRIRYRIDGVLYDNLRPPKEYQSAITSRIKVMANLNIAEHRLPQDGRIKIRLADREMDIRVSVIPTIFGERVVMRLLDKTSSLYSLEDLGLSQDKLQVFLKLIQMSHGIILVTGPTGSGKTTTLYGALSRINTGDNNIITVEDPVEYQLPGIAQMQVKPKIDLTFANGLRSILRQDPDVIMVGEIRDLETAEIAIQASLTGHLVFSTLHTNDAPGATTRLIDMGIEPYLVSSSVIAIMAQRLIRVICPECKYGYVPDEESLAEIGLKRSDLQNETAYRGKGCSSCIDTRYRGRTGIYELLVIDDDIRNLVLSRADSTTIKKKAVAVGMRTLREDGAGKVAAGITTIEEVLRVTQQDIV
jgi:general secretion pathway protein E